MSMQRCLHPGGKPCNGRMGRAKPSCMHHCDTGPSEYCVVMPMVGGSRTHLLAFVPFLAARLYAAQLDTVGSSTYVLRSQR